MTSLDLIAGSRAEEAGYLALADIARLAEQTGIDYRIVGGQMVRLHVAASGAEDPALRQTLDADLGVGHQVAGDPALVDGLEGLGYEWPESANRFVRTAPGGQRLVIDLLAPSYGSRMQTTRRHGRWTVDEIPGLSFALALPGERVELHVRLLDDSTIDLIIVIPGDHRRTLRQGPRLRRPTCGQGRARRLATSRGLPDACARSTAVA